MSDYEEYVDGKKPPINDLKLEIRSKKVPRYSCANHKLNLAIRKSIKDHEKLNNLLKTMSKYASSSKKKLELARILRRKKSKLRKDAKTRWGGSFLMLFTFLKAKEKGKNIFLKF